MLLWAATEKELARKGIRSVKPLAPKVLLPLLENATMENEAPLRALWAQLLASGLAGEKIERSFVKALSDLTGRDAKVLHDLFQVWDRGERHEGYMSALISYESGIDIDKASMATAHKLNALGIIIPTMATVKIFKPGQRWDDDDRTEDEAWVPGELQSIKFTQFGENFCRALGMGKKKRKKGLKQRSKRTRA